MFCYRELCSNGRGCHRRSWCPAGCVRQSESITSASTVLLSRALQQWLRVSPAKLLPLGLRPAKRVNNRHINSFVIASFAAMVARSLDVVHPLRVALKQVPSMPCGKMIFAVMDTAVYG